MAVTNWQKNIFGTLIAVIDIERRKNKTQKEKIRIKKEFTEIKN